MAALGARPGGTGWGAARPRRDGSESGRRDTCARGGRRCWEGFTGAGASEPPGREGRPGPRTRPAQPRARCRREAVPRHLPPPPPPARQRQPQRRSLRRRSATDGVRRPPERGGGAGAAAAAPAAARAGPRRPAAARWVPRVNAALARRRALDGARRCAPGPRAGQVRPPEPRGRVPRPPQPVCCAARTWAPLSAARLREGLTSASRSWQRRGTYRRVPWLQMKEREMNAVIVNGRGVGWNSQLESDPPVEVVGYGRNHLLLMFCSPSCCSGSRSQKCVGCAGAPPAALPLCRLLEASCVRLTYAERSRCLCCPWRLFPSSFSLCFSIPRTCSCPCFSLSPHFLCPEAPTRMCRALMAAGRRRCCSHTPLLYLKRLAPITAFTPVQW